LIEQIMEEITKAYEKMAELPWWTLFVIGCLLPGVGEEIFFRGFLGRGLVARHGPWVGVTVTSILFGVIHLLPTQLVGVIILGAVLHAIYLATKSLTAPILLHTFNNALAFAALKLSKENPRWAMLEKEENIPLVLVLAALMAVIGLGLLLYQTRTVWLLPDGRAWQPGYVTAEMPPASVEATPQCEPASASAIVFGIMSFAVFCGVLAWSWV
jgi:hypothetical protein